MSGIEQEKIFNTIESYGYDDIILMPGFIDFGVNDVNLKTKITKNIEINMPIISSPMDTVTESEMAIKMALYGGIGIIHGNNTIEEQKNMVKQVKRYRNGIIRNPIQFTPNDTIEKAQEIRKKYGYGTFPVTEKGKSGTKWLGIISKVEIDFVEGENKHNLIKDIMKKDNIHYEYDNIELEKAYKYIKAEGLNSLPLIDKDKNLVGIIHRKDLLNNMDYPLSSKDKGGHLLVGAAVSTGKDCYERVKKLVEAGVDIIVIDSAQGNSTFQINLIKHIKSHYNVDVIAGNVVTLEQANNLIKAGADALRVGMGIGSICTTQEVCGVGRGQASAIYHISSNIDIPIIADGGIRGSGTIVKALSLGASTVMCGNLLAGTDEAPGNFFYENGTRLKKYRGMGSLESQKMAMTSKSRYLSDIDSPIVSQGVDGCIAAKGKLSILFNHIIQGVKHGLQDLGKINIDNLHKNRVKLELRRAGALYEGGIHSLYKYNKNSY